MVLKFAVISNSSISREADATPAFYNHVQGAERDWLAPRPQLSRAGPEVLSLSLTCRLTPLGLCTVLLSPLLVPRMGYFQPPSRPGHPRGQTGLGAGMLRVKVRGKDDLLA